MLLSRLSSATSLLQLAVLFFDPPDLSHFQAGKLLLPPVERLRRESQLPHNLSNRSSRLVLTQNKHDLLL